MNEQLVGHDDCVTVGGVRRPRRPPDWEQGLRSGAVTTIAWLLPDVTPAIGDDCDIDGMRHRVPDSTWLPKTPHPGMPVDDRGRAIQLELKIARQALPALVARMGGEVLITEEELEELGRAYGGYENLAVKVTRRGDAFVFRTIRNPHTVDRGRT